MAGTPQIKKPIDNKFNNRRFYLAAVVVALAAFSAMLAQSEAGLDRSSARVARSEAGHPLTPASADAPDRVAGGFLRSSGRSSEDVLASLRTKSTNLGAN